LRLAHWFGTSAQFWLSLQSTYDIRVAEQAAGEEIASLPTKPAVSGEHPKQPGFR
jgi:plasmid maintenance system antidote protein VapI